MQHSSSRVPLQAARRREVEVTVLCVGMVHMQVVGAMKGWRRSIGGLIFSSSGIAKGAGNKRGLEMLEALMMAVGGRG
jgi:hypothetical protein